MRRTVPVIAGFKVEARGGGGGGGGGNELKNTVGNSLPLAASKRVGTLLLQTQEIELC